VACYGMWSIGVKSRLVSLSAKFDPFSFAEFDSSLVEIPPDTTLALQPINAQDVLQVLGQLGSRIWYRDLQHSG